MESASGLVRYGADIHTTSMVYRSDTLHSINRHGRAGVQVQGEGILSLYRSSSRASLLIPGDIWARYTILCAHAFALLAGKKKRGRFGQPIA